MAGPQSPFSNAIERSRSWRAPERRYSDQAKSGWRSGMTSNYGARMHAGAQFIRFVPRRIHAPSFSGHPIRPPPPRRALVEISALGPHAMGPRGPEARAHLSGPTQMGKPSAPMRGGEASRAGSGGEHGGAAQASLDVFEHLAAGRVADYSRIGGKTVWPTGLRRWLKAPVRKGVGSNPTAVIAGAQLPEQPPRSRRLASSECACLRRPTRASRPRFLEASRHRGDESAACPQKHPPWGSNPRP
jgi:hypothetical protein